MRTIEDRPGPFDEKSTGTVFLDRDGVINRDSPHYIKSLSEFEFLPGSLEAIRRLTVYGYSIIVITNQSVIGRGMTPLPELHRIFDFMKKNVQSHGGLITDVFFCPHHPEDNCRCRKPQTGMILDARDTYSIDLAKSIMIGDSVKDILCARNAGIGSAILVRTGNGETAEKDLRARGIIPDFIADDLLDAANRIIETHQTISRHA